MGDWSRLTIGKLVFSWKYHVPTFLTFLFKEDDLFVQPYPDADDDDYLERAGFRTTVSAAKAALERYGYTLEFFADIYESFRPDLDAALRAALDDAFWDALGGDPSEAELRAKIAEHLATDVSSSGLDDLEAFKAFLAEAIEKDLQTEPLIEDFSFDRGGGAEASRRPVSEVVRYRATDLADFDSLQMILFDRIARLPPGVARAAMLFDESWLYYFPEVVSLIYTRLVLDAMPDDALVELEVSEIVDGGESQVRAMHSDLAGDLLLKVDVYQRVFRALSDREEDVKDRFARRTVANSLTSLSQASGAQLKGEALEELMAAVFSIGPQLEVVQRRYSTGDEEIDLVVKNNVARPFWQGLGSPLLFVECKNWSSPVGASEVRDFEVKLQNHTLARVGILVAPAGFTREAPRAIQRASREQYTLALVRREDLTNLARGGKSVLDWLEEVLCRPI